MRWRVVIEKIDSIVNNNDYDIFVTLGSIGLLAPGAKQELFIETSTGCNNDHIFGVDSRVLRPITAGCTTLVSEGPVLRGAQAPLRSTKPQARITNRTI